jgi:hypothetical protein
MSDALRNSVEEAQKMFERLALNSKNHRDRLADDVGSYLILQSQFMAFDLAATHLKSILDTDADAEKLKEDLANMSKPAEPLWCCANPTACGWSGPTSELGEFDTCRKCSGPVVPVGDSCPKCHASFPHENAKIYQGLRHCPTCGATLGLGVAMPPVSRDLTQCRRCKVVLPPSDSHHHDSWGVVCQSCFRMMTAQTLSPKET